MSRLPIDPASHPAPSHTFAGLSIGKLALVASATCFLLNPIAAQSPFGDRHVLIIGIDGVRSDALQAAATPNLDGLVATGAVSWDAGAGGALAVGDPTHQATSSGPGWASILTGGWVDRHGVASNGEFSSGAHELANFPHLFGRLRPLYPTAYLSSIVQWHPINVAMLDPWPSYASFTAEVADSGQAVENAAVAHLRSADPDVLFLHFDDVDHAGHGSGFRSTNAAYITAIQQTDQHIGVVLQALRARPNYASEDWLILATTDHGGRGTSHGGHSAEERTIWIIAQGGGVQNAVLTPGPGHTVITRTALHHLGVTPPARWGLSDARPFGYAERTSSVPIPADAEEYVGLDVELSWLSGADAVAQEVFFGVDPVPGQSEFRGRQDSTRYQPGVLASATRYFWRVDTITAAGRIVGPVWSFETIGALTEGQVLHLPFDGNAQDVSGRGHDGTLHGDPTFVDSGRIGSAIVLDGTGDHVSVAHGPDFAFGAATDFTIAFWIRSPGWSADAPFVSNKDWSSGANPGYLIGGETGGTFWQWNFKGSQAARADLDRIGAVGGAALTWHHVAVVHDRDGYATFYQDGIQVGRADIAGQGDVDTGLPLAIGQDGTLSYAHSLQGDLDELRVWRRVLGAVEIESLAQPLATSGRPVDGATGVGREPLLSWSAATEAVAHDVYFGTSPQLGAAELRGRTAAPLFSLRALLPGTTYYWRIDTVGPTGPRRGDVWRFTTTPNLSADSVVRLAFEGDLLDGSGRNNHGSALGDPGYSTTGAVGHAIELDGTADAVSLGNPADLRFGSAVDFTIACWIRSSGWVGDPPILANKDWASGSNLGWLIAGDPDGQSWQWNYRGATSSRRDFDAIGVIADGVWHHLAVVHDRDGDATFYQDGRRVGRVTIAASGSVDSGLPTALGEDGTLSYGIDLPADLDDVRVWRRALGARDVVELYLVGATAGCHALGGSVAGSSGHPDLSGTGLLQGNDLFRLDLVGARSFATGLLVLSTRLRFVPFGDGVFVPGTDLILPLATSAQGTASLTFTWPAGLPARTMLFTQAWIADASASFGLAAAPGLVCITP